MMFFFQAEDGIRDGHVTGVQTCALPILGEMLDGYMATDGAADVTQTVLAWGAPYYTKLAMASAGGRAPDLAVMHAARVPGYAPGGLLEDRKSTRLTPVTWPSRMPSSA